MSLGLLRRLRNVRINVGLVAAILAAAALITLMIKP